MSRLGILSLTIAALLATGCAGVAQRPVLPITGMVTSLPTIKAPSPTVGAYADGSRPVEMIETDSIEGDEYLVAKDAELASEALPNWQVDSISFSGLGLREALRSLVEATNGKIALAYKVEGVQAPSTTNLSMLNLSGSFADVLDKLSRAAGFYWHYRNGLLTIEQDRAFQLSLPPVPALYDPVVIMTQRLGATEVMLDKSSRTLAYRASRSAQSRIEAYLGNIRRNRPIITYDMSILEVNLSDGNKMGVNWSSLPAAGSATRSLVSPGTGLGTWRDGNSGALAFGIGNALSMTGGTGIGMVFSGAEFAMNVLVDFLNTQGTVNSISQPKLSLLAGNAAQIRSGENITYFNQISPGSLVNGAWTAGSVTTAQLKLGLMMTVAGDVADNLVWTDIVMLLTDLNSLNEKQVSVNQGSVMTIALPRTSDREVATQVVARPGDIIVIGGINAQRMSNTQSGVASVNTGSDIAGSRTELVVVMTPRVTYFNKRVRPSSRWTITQEQP